MPPLTFALILIGVLAAAGLTIWGLTALGLPLWLALIAGLSVSAALRLWARRG